jgi:NADPH:quinone reductase-like Zn-dependent oxidoreductase
VNAAVYTRYGPPDVLQLTQVDQPTPKENELLVRVHATTVRAGDCRMRRADPFMARFFNGLFRPSRVTVLGMELAGEVEAVGAQVKQFAPGDPVFATTGLKFGAYADYCCLPEDAVVTRKPESMSFAQAATVPSGGIAALELLRQGQIARGQKVLIYGASGSVGSFAVQLARHFGADVTAVCSGGKREWVQSLGAQQVIDYALEDVTARDERYDLVFDAVGKMISGIAKSRFKRVLAPGGRVVSIEMNYTENVDALVTLRELADAGAITATIARCYPLAEIADAHRYAESGHQQGAVVIAPWGADVACHDLFSG